VLLNRSDLIPWSIRLIDPPIPAATNTRPPPRSLADPLPHAASTGFSEVTLATALVSRASRGRQPL